nr:MAG TPA: ASCH domain protein [Caudoviricetes sp.]
MAIKPILFNTKMVRAILDGRKSCTRRIVKYDVGVILNSQFCRENPDVDGKQIISKLCIPLYQPGDILYVRETWSEGYEEGTYIYKADDKLADLPTFKESSKLIYHPSIHMPKEAARIWLKVTDVKVERLQEISGEDLIKEGIDLFQSNYVRVAFDEFKNIWNSTIKKSDLDRYGWNANPYVFVIEFVRIDKPEEIQNA